VYRTLKLLKRHGLIDELDLMHLQGEKHFYERRPQRDHLHMACLRCGKILEFESDLFDRLKGQIQRELPVPYFGYTYGDRRLLLSLPQPAFVSCNWLQRHRNKKKQPIH